MKIYDAKANLASGITYLDEIKRKDIHSGALEILQNIGFDVHHEEALELLEKAGAYVDGNHVYVDPALVEWALKQAPSTIMLYDREGEPAMLLQGRNAYFGTGSDCPYLVDTFTGERRNWHVQDVIDAVRIVDALPAVDFTMSMGIIEELNPKSHYQQQYAIMIRNTSKPQVIIAENAECLNDVCQIAAAVRGGMDELSRKPLFVLYDEPTSPLVNTKEALEKLLYMAEHRLPTNYACGMMSGSTGPITPAGAVCLATAENLMGLVIHQLKNPGAPFVFGGGMSNTDMVSMQPSYTSPEAMMTQGALTEMGRDLYNLPTWGFAGCSNSKIADEQAMNDAATYIWHSGLNGTHINHALGYLEFGLSFSFDLLVMCNEVVSQLRRVFDGIVVNRDTLAIEAVKRVGPGGHFLGDEHTFRHFNENWRPDLFDRNLFEKWVGDGRTTLGERVKVRVKDIIENHVPKALPAEIDAKIDAILEDIENRYK
ncbi:MAG: trimethylamine methyltransferase family protein [Firmicutes bacterium]|nr:trimethylamine methyltransferase family protein [Bacillota bacterium]